MGKSRLGLRAARRHHRKSVEGTKPMTNPEPTPEPCKTCGGSKMLPNCSCCPQHTCGLITTCTGPVRPCPDCANEPVEFVKEWREKLKNAKALFEMGKTPTVWFQSITTNFLKALSLITTQQARIVELKDCFRRILKEANKPAIHTQTWKVQAVEWEKSFLVAKLVAEQALKGE